MLLGSGESGVGGGPKVAVHLWKIGRLEQPLSQHDHREIMVGVDEPGGAETAATTGQRLGRHAHLEDNSEAEGEGPVHNVLRQASRMS